MPALLSLLAFLIVATGIIGSMVVAAMILRVKARYYVVALFFVLFDLEAAFLFPWATVARQAGPAGFEGALSFVVILMVGWVWAMRKGALKWQ